MRISWRVMGTWMVVVAVAFAVIAIALALLQATSLTSRLMAEAELRAGKIAVEASQKIQAQLEESLRVLASNVAAGLDATWKMPAPFPDWIVSAYAHDSIRMYALMPESPENEHVVERLKTIMAELLLRPTPPFVDEQIQLKFHRIDDVPCIVALRRGRTPVGNAFVVAARLDPSIIRMRFLDPLVDATEGLEVVPMRDASSRWARNLDGALRYWAIQPTTAYRREERASVMGQTLAYVGLTTLALASLLTAVWFVTKVARREMALIEAKAEFVANMSHELKTPLALIKMFAETLESDRIADPKKRKEYYAVISRESTRLTNLIENILNYSRIEAGMQQYRRSPIDVALVIQETYEAYRLELDEKGFEHSLQVTDALPKIEADRDAIAQALVNLIGNAVKYSDQDRYVAIEVTADTRRNRSGVLISVHDRGIGISPEARRRLFEGFYRADDERVRLRRGTGLGLALLKHIVDAHNGSLHVESRLVKGTTFRIFLPECDSESQNAAAAHQGHAES